MTSPERQRAERTGARLDKVRGEKVYKEFQGAWLRRKSRDIPCLVVKFDGKDVYYRIIRESDGALVGPVNVLDYRADSLRPARAGEIVPRYAINRKP